MGALVLSTRLLMALWNVYNMCQGYCGAGPSGDLQRWQSQNLVSVFQSWLPPPPCPGAVGTPSVPPVPPRPPEVEKEGKADHLPGIPGALFLLAECLGGAAMQQVSKQPRARAHEQRCKSARSAVLPRCASPGRYCCHSGRYLVRRSDIAAIPADTWSSAAAYRK